MSFEDEHGLNEKKGAKSKLKKMAGKMGKERVLKDSREFTWRPTEFREKRLEQGREDNKKILGKMDGVSSRKSRGVEMEKRSKKAGFYVHGHKNLGDVYEK